MKARKWIIISMVCGFLLPLVGSESSSEDMLASVEIDDLLRRKTDKIEDKKPEVVEITDINHVGDSATNIQVERFKLDELMVLAELKYQIAKQFKISDDFRLFFSRPWAEVTLRSPNWRIVMTSYPPQGLRSQFYANFELWVDGKRLASFQRSLNCELWVDAYVSLQRIDRGTNLHEGLVDVRPVDALSLFQTTVEIGTPLHDFVLTNGIRAGEPIYLTDLKERPLIEKNSVIDVFAQEGLLRVSLKAKALENGVKGQIIRIRNLQSHNDIQAEVIGVNKARVHF